MVVLRTCKNEEDLIKMKALVCLQDNNIIGFSDAIGQLTAKSAAEFCLNWNSSKLL